MSDALRLGLVWAGLLALLASQAVLGRVLDWGNAALALGLSMAALTVVFFMEIRRGPSQIRVFAAAGLFWLLVLLMLGIMDPLTRFDLPVGSLPSAAAAP